MTRPVIHRLIGLQDENELALPGRIESLRTGITVTPGSVRSVMTTLTNWPGQSERSALGNSALSLMVPVVLSTELSIKVSCPVTLCSGEMMAVTASGLFFAVSADVVQKLLRHAESHIDRLHLIDVDQRRWCRWP